MIQLTIIQASICNKKKAIILIADRLVTAYDTYEAEAKSEKIYRIGSYGIGFAGTLLDMICVKDKIEENNLFEPFIDSIIDIYKEENKKREENLILNYTFLSKKEFKEYILHDQGKIPEEIINWIYGNLEETRLDCSALVIGFNSKNEPQIIQIDPLGEKYNRSEIFHDTIGSGDLFSDVFFDVGEYNPDCSLEQGLLFVYRAKRTAEAHTGVGKHTDVLIIRQNKEPLLILNDSKEMKEFEKIYEEERFKIQDLYNKNIEKIKELIK